MYTDIRVIKNELRQKYIKQRKDIPKESKEILDNKITENFLKLLSYKHANQILFFASSNSEISTDKLFLTAIEDGKSCFFPKCYSKSRMEFFKAECPSELSPGMFGVREPICEDKPFSQQPSDIIIVPAITYDEKGFRLGYGKGFYDRFLPKFMGVKIGLCYDSLIAKELPRGRFDVSVDMLLTEKGVVVF